MMFGHNGFPTIRHIDDVLPALDGRKNFAIKRGDGYTAIDYLYVDDDTFDDPMRRECRGIKFGADGRIIARPYHKFFNLGEKPETQQGLIDWTLAHVVLEKLDGSMVHPALVGGALVWMTRAGITPISIDAGRHAEAAGYATQCRKLIEDGMTPIFEWCSPRNQIVIRYPEDRLILTAARRIETGDYLSVEDHAFAAVRKYGQSVADLAAFLAHTRDLKDQEGYVVRFDTGAMLKIKADDYVLRHKARDSLLLEKNVLKIVLEDATDDVIPLLAPDDAARLDAYRVEVLRSVQRHADRIRDTVARAKAELGDDRKRFATEVAAAAEPIWKFPMFVVWNGADPREAVTSVLLKYCGSQTGVDEIRPLLDGLWWKPPEGEIEAG
jgi:RNA ligase